MENVLVKPLGQILEEAGLVSDSQISTALEIQSKYGQFKFGTILVTLGILQHKTVDFFVEQFPKILEYPKTKPLGYYLEKAALINDQQIEIILQEQKETGRLFGELVIQKGWLKAKTINFFLYNLDKMENKMQLLSTSPQEKIKPINTQTKTPKAASHYSLLKEVFFWTGGHPLLTRHICQIISDSDEFIPEGVEVIWVEKLIHDCVIHNWENQSTGKFFKATQDYLLNNKVCFPINLLRLYLRILQRGEIKTDDSIEKKELINLGLVIEQENKLKISNRIYQSIFNVEWVEKQLSALENNSQIIANKSLRNKARNKLTSTAIKIKNEPFTQVAALIIVLGLLLTSPIIIFFNNSQHKLSQAEANSDSQSLSPSTAESTAIAPTPPSLPSASESLSKSNLCLASIPSDYSTRQDWRIRLEQRQRELKEQFPNTCQNNLDKLLVLDALKLGKENRVLDGINHLCKISETSGSFNQAKFWLSRWYNSPDWGNQTKYYLESIDNCPVAEPLLSVSLK